MRALYIQSYKGGTLFAVQYLCLAYLMISGSLYPSEWYNWIPYITGWIIGLWSIVAMGRNNLNTGPDVLPGARLVKAGPYRFIRHPMYAAILLVFIPLTLTTSSLPRFAVLAVLTLNLLLKLNYEERRLRSRFREYSEYSKGTWRLLPYVY